MFVENNNCEKEKNTKDFKTELNNATKNNLSNNRSINSEKLFSKHE